MNTKKKLPRSIQPKLLELSKQFPALAILGPRQSGKTTLARTLFPHYRYINLESFEEQEYAEKDPKGFLNRFKDESGVILDEIQKTPKLLSYIQIEIDERDEPGRFILTGSQNILLNAKISQTLAGWIALTTLLPFSFEELREEKKLPKDAMQAIFQGFYPRVYDNNLDPVIFSESYMRTYVERDVREITQVTSLSEFQKFIRLCAGRIGQLLNISSLATDGGISVKTAKAWLSVLEASYVIFLLEPFHNNFSKRLVKSPKLYFYDTALACNLLKITKTDDLFSHYLRGGLFESMIISNLIKNRFHHCLPSNLYFWRDKTGNEIDCIFEEGSTIFPIEIKSTETLNTNLFDSLCKWSEISGQPKERGKLIYAGTERQTREGVSVIPWNLS